MLVIIESLGSATLNPYYFYLVFFEFVRELGAPNVVAIACIVGDLSSGFSER